MKTKHKIIIGIVAVFTFIFALAIFSDWVHIKAGLLGKPPVVEVEM